MHKLFGLLFLLVASVMGLVLAVDAEGNPVYAEWPAEQTDQLYGNLQTFDPDQKGLDRSKLRFFYGKLGWNDIQQGIDQLIASGRLEAKVVPMGQAQVEVFVWKEV